MKTVTLLIVLSALPLLAQKEFPEGTAKQYVEKICMQCHEPTMLLAQKRTELDWKKTVQRMSTKGVGAPAEQYDAVAAYMFANFGKTEEAETGKVNVNTAKPEELVSTLGLSASEAKALVDYRTKHGDFRVWGDILVIYGVDGRKVEAAKDKLTF